MPSTRAELVTRRTYCRPLGDSRYETWEQVVVRVIDHQRWLWERALGRPLVTEEESELTDLSILMKERKVLPSGRILWMGGTPQARRTEIAMFNCSFADVRDVYSAVDAFYLLLNGSGVGFKPVSGLLNGFTQACEVEVRRSSRKGKGRAENKELWYSEQGTRIFHLEVGDSGVAWAKALGKLLAEKTPFDKLILDFNQIRAPGHVLAGYGWLSSGDEQIAEAFEHICAVLNRRAGKLLDELDILDIINLAGTTLTSRRSAEIALMHAHHPLAEDFADAKRDHYENGMPWRSQSNNSLVFWKKPSKLELRGLFQRMLDAGGSEPGLYNGEAARKRAPWFSGTNPCGEILLPDGGLCNLVEVDLGKFVEKSWRELASALRLIARANYRQTCVYLKDGVLSDRWHETQQFLRLCGVGLTGIVKWLDAVPASEHADILQDMRYAAEQGAHSMADELGLPRPKAVTTVKPSGTLSKIMDTTEGLHRPLGRYVFNNIKFDKHDALLPKLLEAGYRIIPDPYSTNNVLVTFPVDYGSKQPEYNQEAATDQLDRYLLLMKNYVDHNASVSISYDPTEIPEIVEWLHENWDDYVGVSFILRTDPTKTAKDLGYPYLPQEVVSEKTFLEYAESLAPVDLEGGDMLDLDDCEGGACPVR